MPLFDNDADAALMFHDADVDYARYARCEMIIALRMARLPRCLSSMPRDMRESACVDDARTRAITYSFIRLPVIAMRACCDAPALCRATR